MQTTNKYIRWPVEEMINVKPTDFCLEDLKVNRPLKKMCIDVRWSFQFQAQLNP